MASVLDTHPQRQKIIDAILAGTPVRDIASWTNPPVSFNAIQRYKKSNVRPAMQRADVLKTILIGENAIPPDTDTKELVQAAIRSGPVLAVREERIAAAQQRHDRLMSIITERGPTMADVPGGKSGLLQEKVKQFGSEYVVDHALLSELREHEKQIATELGQWQDQPAHNVNIQIVYPAANTVSPVSQPYQTIDIALPKR